MAGVRFRKGTEEFQMLQDYWNLMQGFWEPEESDCYWDEAIKAADMFYKKYKTPFARDLAAALMKDLDRRSRQEISI